MNARKFGGFLIVGILLGVTCVGLAAFVKFSSATADCGLFACFPYDVSNGGQNSTNPFVATSGQYVYVAWTAPRYALIRVNSDYGNPDAWSNPIELTSVIGGIGALVMTANDSYVYIAFPQQINGTNNIMFSVSSNYGANFTTENVSNMTGMASQDAITPVLASWNTTVYLGFDVETNGPSYGSWVVASTNAGESWETPNHFGVNYHEPQTAATAEYGYAIADGSNYVYTNNLGATWHHVSFAGQGFGGVGSEPWITASDQYVYVTSEYKGTGGQSQISVYVSDTNGTTFQSDTLVSGDIINDWQPQIAAQGSNVYLAFRTLGDLNNTPPETISAYMVSSANGGINWTAPTRLSLSGHYTSWPDVVSVQGQYAYTIFGEMTTSNGDVMDAEVAQTSNLGASYSIYDVSGNSNAGVAAPPTDLESAQIVSSGNGTQAFAVWQMETANNFNSNGSSYANGTSTWQIYFNGPYTNPSLSSSTTSSSTTSSANSSSFVSITSTSSASSSSFTSTSSVVSTHYTVLSTSRATSSASTSTKTSPNSDTTTSKAAQVIVQAAPPKPGALTTGEMLMILGLLATGVFSACGILAMRHRRTPFTKAARV